MDGSENSLKSVSVALDIAVPCGAEVTGLYVIDEAELGHDYSRYAPGEIETELRRVGTAKLDLAEKKFKEAAVSFEREIVIGIPYKAIVKMSSDYDMIVMCTHGRTMLQKAFLGSVADKVIRSADCPVTTVR